VIKLRNRAADPAPAPPFEGQGPDGAERATFAAGCFWGVEAAFRQIHGVLQTAVGYTGGHVADPTYERVCRHRTGHAEAVEVTFDPAQISYGRILQIYFSVAHNPTQLNYQGPDQGPQYRSEIFPRTEEQAKVASAYIAQLDAAKAYPRPIVTKVGSLMAAFYPAEGYHQDYATLHPNQPYIVFNDAPKVANLKAMFPALYRDKPVLVADAAER